MRNVAQTMSGGEEGKEMRVRTMEISGVSGASALKMCYRGISKAIAGLGGYGAFKIKAWLRIEMVLFIAVLFQ